MVERGEREEECRVGLAEDSQRYQGEPSPGLAGLYKWNVPHGLDMHFQVLTHPENCLVQVEYSSWIQ